MRRPSQEEFVTGLKRVVDRYELELEVKNSHVGNAYDFVFITS